MLINVIFITKNVDHFTNKLFDKNTELVVVTAHYNENLDWLKNCKYPLIVCDKYESLPMPFERDANCTIENKGQEASVFLKFIISYYDELPKYVAFIHGHETSPHQKYPHGILHAIENAKKETYKFISLNNEFQSMIIDPSLQFDNNHTTDIYANGHNDHIRMQRLWENLYKPYLKIDFPTRLRYQRSAQFIVSRECIQRHPVEFYEKLFQYTTHPELIDSDTTHVQAAYVLEFSWHMIFGENPDMCDTDQNDPLFTSCIDDTYLKTRFNLS
jgi:hypothetical protein